MITLKIKYNRAYGEYCVAYLVDGIKDDAKSYYTDAMDDAKETMGCMQAEINNKQCLTA